MMFICQVLHTTNKRVADLIEELEQAKGTLQTQTTELERKDDEVDMCDFCAMVDSRVLIGGRVLDQFIV